MSVFINDKTTACTNTEPHVTVNSLQRSGHSTGRSLFCCRSGSHSLEKKGSFESCTGYSAVLFVGIAHLQQSRRRANTVPATPAHIKTQPASPEGVKKKKKKPDI